MRKLMYILMACFMAFGIVSCSDSGSDEPGTVTLTATLDPAASGNMIASPTEVTLTTVPADAAIWYTIDESDPRDSENPDRLEYTGPFNITGIIGTDMTLRAIAEAAGWTTGEFSADYTFAAQVATPTSTPTAEFGARQVEDDTDIVLSTATLPAVEHAIRIFFTYGDTEFVDENSVGWVEYSEEVGSVSMPNITGTQLKFRAIAIRDDMRNSGILEAEYTVAAAETVAMPYALIETQDGDPPTATITSGTAIRLETATASAAIYYTDNGLTPDRNSILYDSETGLDTSGVAGNYFIITAIAIDTNTDNPLNDSEVLGIGFTIVDTE